MARKYISKLRFWKMPRMPVCTIIDTSGSMAGFSIFEVNQAM